MGLYGDGRRACPQAAHAGALDHGDAGIAGIPAQDVRGILGLEGVGQLRFLAGVQGQGALIQLDRAGRIGIDDSDLDHKLCRIRAGHQIGGTDRNRGRAKILGAEDIYTTIVIDRGNLPVVAFHARDRILFLVKIQLVLLAEDNLASATDILNVNTVARFDHIAVRGQGRAHDLLGDLLDGLCRFGLRFLRGGGFADFV